MAIARRTILGAALAAPALLRATGARAAARTLKISHQFPGGTIDQGDFRDRLARRFAAEVQKRTNGELGFEIYPGSSLMKTIAQFGALRKGALDLSVYPLAYAGGEVPEVNIGLLPTLVTNYDQGLAWKSAPIGKALTDLLDKRGIRILTWLWQAGGIASRGGPLVRPADTRGLKIRGGSREFDLLLKAAGGIISSSPSDEIYANMQTGALDAAVTSSTSIMSFRLVEIAKNVTTARTGSFWFIFTPLLMSKQVFDSLTPAQQDAIVAAGAAQEPFCVAASRADDQQLATVFTSAGLGVNDMDAATLDQWRAIARDTAWKDYSERSESCANMLRLAQGVAA